MKNLTRFQSFSLHFQPSYVLEWRIKTVLGNESIVTEDDEKEW